MRKILILICALFLSACSYKVEFNEKTETTMIESSKNSTLKLAVYAPISKTQTLKAATNLGKDDKISINLEDYAKQTTVKYFKNYFRNVTPISNLEEFKNYDYVLIPGMNYFEYGFSSNDGFDIDVKPYVQYDLQFAIKKGNETIFNKILNESEKPYRGQLIFFGQGKEAYGSIDSLIQNSMFEYYSKNISEILRFLK